MAQCLVAYFLNCLKCLYFERKCQNIIYSLLFTIPKQTISTIFISHYYYNSDQASSNLQLSTIYHRANKQNKINLRAQIMKNQHTLQSSCKNTFSRVNESKDSSDNKELHLLMFQKTEASNLFPDTQSYPQFFQQNLLSDNRIIKVIEKGVHSNIQVFYYQLLLLNSINDNQSYQKSRANIFKEILFSQQFEILFTHDSQNFREIFNNNQFKKLLQQFYNLLENSDKPPEHIINRIPIIDTIFVHVIRSLVYYMGVNEQFEKTLNDEIIFVNLAQHLGLRITCYTWEQGTCWKFEDSDMFCLDDASGNLFIAYVPSETQVKSLIENVQNKNENNIQYKQQTFSQQSDFIEIQKIQLHPKVENILKKYKNYQNETYFEEQTQMGNPILEKTHDLQNNQLINDPQHVYCSQLSTNCRIQGYRNPIDQFQNSYFSSQNNNETSTFSIGNQSNHINFVMQPEIYDPYEYAHKSIKPKFLSNTRPHINYNSEQPGASNFYKQKKIHQIFDSSINYEKQTPNKFKNCMIQIKQKSIGSYYKDFTSSFTLNVVAQPFRSQVRNIKTRVKNMNRF